MVRVEICMSHAPLRQVCHPERSEVPSTVPATRFQFDISQ